MQRQPCEDQVKFLVLLLYDKLDHIQQPDDNDKQPQEEEEEEEEGEEATELEIVCPEGAEGGDVITVTVDGDELDLEIPEGVVAGETFSVRIE